MGDVPRLAVHAFDPARLEQSGSAGTVIHVYDAPSDSREQRAALRELEDLKSLLFAPLFDHHRSLMRVAEPADIVQDVCLAFLAARNGYDPTKGAEFTTYVYHAVNNALTDRKAFEAQYRRSGPDYRIITESALNDVTDADGQALPFCERYGSEDRGFATAENSAVRAFVAGLPPRQRQVVHLVYWEGYTPAEAARRLGITRGAVSQLLKKARSTGKEVLASHYVSTEPRHLDV